MDATLIARAQFAFTISFHILFPAFTIGLASYLAVLEALYLATKREAFHALYRLWIKDFAVTFAMGWCRESCCPTSSAPTGAASPT
jgi:cytochrome d ubiquinol oxidase subunit I